MQKLLKQIVELTGRQPQVLVVDDDPITVQVLQGLLATLAEVAVAYTRQAALDQCHALPPDLILLDVNLGRDNGFELCQQLKRERQFAYTPIIFITGSIDAQDEARAFAMGAVDFIRKPIEPSVALARVTTHLALKLQSDFLTQLANLDGLTGLKNRRHFDEVLQREWKECARARQPLSLLMADIDHFKAYNDSYGHMAGDHCLQAVAHVFGEAMQRPGDCAARYGGEEFACILPRTDLAGACAIARNLHDRIAALRLTHGAGATADHIVTVSLGVASCIPGPGTSLAGLMAEADQQLYRAKRGGRDQVRCEAAAP